MANGELQGADRELREAAVAREVRQKLEAVLSLPVLGSRFPLQQEARFFPQDLASGLHDDPAAWPTLLGWLFTHALGKVVDEADFEQIARSWCDEWLLGKIISGALQDLGLDEGAAWRAVTTIKILTSHQRWFEGQQVVSVGRVSIPASEKEWAYRVLESWLKDDEVQQFLQVNRYRGVLWFNKEAFEQLLWWMMLPAVVALTADPLRPTTEVAQEIAACYDVVKELQRAEEESGYQVEKLLEVVKGGLNAPVKALPQTASSGRTGLR